MDLEQWTSMRPSLAPEKQICMLPELLHQQMWFQGYVWSEVTSLVPARWVQVVLGVGNWYVLSWNCGEVGWSLPYVWRTCSSEMPRNFAPAVIVLTPWVGEKIFPISNGWVQVAFELSPTSPNFWAAISRSLLGSSPASERLVLVKHGICTSWRSPGCTLTTF